MSIALHVVINQLHIMMCIWVLKVSYKEEYDTTTAKKERGTYLIN